LRPAWANSFQETPSSKKTTVKWTGGAARVVEHMFYKCKALRSNLSSREKERLDCKMCLHVFSKQAKLFCAVQFLTRVVFRKEDGAGFWRGMKKTLEILITPMP
jgi:hypothetical protein